LKKTGERNVGWRDVAVVCAGRRIAAVRRGRYPHNAGISGDEMGIRTGHRIYGSGRCVPLRPWLPRAIAQGLHERYTAARWQQALGSTMHCVAGDGLGILTGAVLSSFLHFPGTAEVIVEYILGFGFGWTVFQALFMRDMAGGSYHRALKSTFAGVTIDEFPDDRNVGDSDDTEEVCSIRRGSHDAELLVRDVNGAAGRFYRILPDELVVGCEPSQAWHDDRAPCEREFRAIRSSC
jgi:hypothetical protein